MPETRVVVDGFPLTYPRQEGVHQDHLLHLGGELTGVGVGDHQAYVVPDHAGSLDAEQPGERVNARGRRFDVQTGRRDLRFADAGEIRRDHRESLREDGNDRLPHPRCLRVAVQQDHRGTLTAGQVMQLDAVDVRGARNKGVTTSVRVRGRGDGNGERVEGGQNRRRSEGALHPRLLCLAARSRACSTPDTGTVNPPAPAGRPRGARTGTRPASRSFG